MKRWRQSLLTDGFSLCVVRLFSQAAKAEALERVSQLQTQMEERERVLSEQVESRLSEQRMLFDQECRELREAFEERRVSLERKVQDAESQVQALREEIKEKQKAVSLSHVSLPLPPDSAAAPSLGSWQSLSSPALLSRRRSAEDCIFALRSEPGASADADGNSLDAQIDALRFRLESSQARQLHSEQRRKHEVQSLKALCLRERKLRQRVREASLLRSLLERAAQGAAQLLSERRRLLRFCVLGGRRVQTPSGSRTRAASAGVARGRRRRPSSLARGPGLSARKRRPACV